MKRPFSLLAPLSLLAALGLSSAYAITPQQEAQAYGQSVLRVYARQSLSNKPAAMTDKACSELVQLATPTGQGQPSAIRQCTVHIWGKQAVAEVLYEVAGNPMNNWRRVWVGQMRGLPSDWQARKLTEALARDYVDWSQSTTAQQWFKQAAKEQGQPDYGYTIQCTVFAKTKLPAGIKSCIEGPGPADGPTITLRLADGRIFDKGI